MPSRRPSESWLMKTLSWLGFRGLSWSARRLHCPVSNDDLVLEVGSGGNPYFRSNVLVDAYESTRERHWAPLISDRPTVLGFVERLPFRDKVFDFVIASHVFEHSKDPVKFLSELQRVAKAGYIEVPDAFMERINPYKDHRLEITVRNDRLIIRKKHNWIVDFELVELYEKQVKNILTQKTMRLHPFEFHVRYYWEDEIDYLVLNPEVDVNWVGPESTRFVPVIPKFRHRLSQAALKLIRVIFSQNRRNSNISMQELLTCPTCQSIELDITDISIICKECAQTYSVHDGIPVMYHAI